MQTEEKLNPVKKKKKENLVKRRKKKHNDMMFMNKKNYHVNKISLAADEKLRSRVRADRTLHDLQGDDLDLREDGHDLLLEDDLDLLRGGVPDLRYEGAKCVHDLQTEMYLVQYILSTI